MKRQWLVAYSILFIVTVMAAVQMIHVVGTVFTASQNICPNGCDGLPVGLIICNKYKILVAVFPFVCFLQGVLSLKIRAFQSPLAIAALSSVCIGFLALLATMLVTPIVMLGGNI
jgi:hypothetical protein